MFQKLYRHLEEIKDGLQRDSAKTEAAQVGGKVIEQLEGLNARLRALQRQSLLSISSVLTVATIACIIFFITRRDQNPRNDRAISPQSSIGLTPQVKEDQAEKSMLLQHLGALDSLIAEQARSIHELKELNATSVATFRRIRRHFYLTEGMAGQSRPVPADSFTVANKRPQNR